MTSKRMGFRSTASFARSAQRSSDDTARAARRGQETSWRCPALLGEHTGSHAEAVISSDSCLRAPGLVRPVSWGSLQRLRLDSDSLAEDVNPY